MLSGRDVTHQNWWFHQPKWIHLRENLHESFCNVNLSPMSLGFPWFSCRCSPNQMPGPFGGKTRIPPPLALQTRGAKLPPVLRLQMSLEGLSRLWNSEPSRIRGRISWIYIYIMLCVFVYIYIYTHYIYICIICIVTQQPPKTNDRKTRQLPSQQNSWSMNFPVPLLPIRRPAALFRRGYLPKTRIHGIWMGLRYTCYPLVILT